MIEDYKGIFVFVEQIDGNIVNVSYELIGKAKELASVLETEVTAVLLGDKISDQCENLARYGADKVIVVDDSALKDYMTEPYTRALTAVVEEFKPEIMFYGATAIGRDLAPRVSARVHTGLTADCTSLAIEENGRNLLMTRPAFGGNIMATIVCKQHRPQMATVRPGVMQRISPIENPKCEIINFAVANLEDGKNISILDIIQKVTSKMDIGEANILVAGGRGMGSQENFKLLEDLAKVLGGSVASSRASVDAGWVEKELQVGQTGTTVRPNLYIACGISGAIQHLAGMEESEVIVAINKDPSAPIFDVADFGIVGDVRKILPAITEKIKAALEHKANS